MAVDQAALESYLRGFEPEALVAVLEAAGIGAGGADGSAALARRITRALWWRTHTPVGAQLMPTTLDDIVDAVEARAALALGQGDVFERLRCLAQLCGAAAAPDPTVLAKLRPGLPWGAMAGTTAAGTAAGVRQGSLWALRQLARGGSWIPLLPTVGPVFVTVRQGLRTAARISAPVGAALALASLNGALGADYARALPLLVGIGVLDALNPGDP